MLSKFNDRLWWLFNSKPSKRATPYIALVVAAVFTGAIICFGALLLVAIVTTPAKTSAFGWSVAIGIPLLAVSGLVWGSILDYKSGYVDAFYQAYQAKRERIGKKLGKL